MLTHITDSIILCGYEIKEDGWIENEGRRKEKEAIFLQKTLGAAGNREDTLINMKNR